MTDNKKFFLSLLLTALSILHQLSFTAGAFALEENTEKKPAYISVEKYRLTLELYPERHAISGEVEILTAAGSPPGDSGEIILNLHADMDVRAIRLYPNGEIPDYKRFHDLIKFRAAQKFDKIFVSFYGDPSRYITQKNSFTYIGDEGCYFDDLCAYFPRAGFDQKSLFEINVIHYDDWKIISQGEEEEPAGGKKIDKTLKTAGGQKRLAVTRIVNNKKTRCHTLAAGPYVKKSRSGIQPYNYTVSAYFFENEDEAAEAHLEEAAAILNYYRDHYGDNCIKKLGVVEIEKVFPGGYGPEEVVYITAAAVKDGAVDYELLAHEIAHQWFGNFVMGEFPGSNFLNEAFATYASLEYIKDKHSGGYHRKYEEARRSYLSYRAAAATREISIEAAGSAAGGPAYQTLIYHRGMMVLKNLLYFMAKAAEKKESDIIAGFLEKYSQQTVTVDEFKNFLFSNGDGLFSKTALRDPKSFEAAKFYFEKFYHTTAAVELEVKEAVIKDLTAEKPGVTPCAMTIERTDEIERDTDITISFYEGGANKLIRKKSFNLKRGTNKLNIDLDGIYQDIKYRVDEENAYPLSYKIHRFGRRPDESERLIIYDTSGTVSGPFNALCRELAFQAGSNAKADTAFDARDFFKYRDILLIGNFSNSPIMGLVNTALNFYITAEKIGIQKSFNSEAFNFKSGTAAKFTAKNPFITGGTVTAVLFFDRAAAGAYNKLTSGHDDYCVYDTKTKELITGNFNYGLSGVFEKNGGVTMLYGGAGLNNNFILKRPSAVIFDFYNTLDSTAEIEIEISAKDRGEVPANATIILPPHEITRHESFPFTLNRQKIDYLIKNKNGAVIFEGTLDAKSFSPENDSFAVGASKDGDFNKISYAINYLNSKAGYIKRKRATNIINAGFNNFPLNSVCYKAFKAVILNDYDIAAARTGFAETLKSYAADGGRIIISGGGMSEISSGATASFIKEIFGAQISSSKLYSFDDSIAGIRARPYQSASYIFHEVPWDTSLISVWPGAQIFTGAASGQKSLVLPGDNPVLIYCGDNNYADAIEKPVSLFGGKLIMRRFGGGVFYYLPYDFSDELLRQSVESTYILMTALHGGPPQNAPLITGEAPDHIVYNPQDHPWPFTISYFIIFILLYISALAAVYARAAKNKTGGRYLIELIGVTCFFCVCLTAAVYFLTRIDYPPEALGFTELSGGIYGPVSETVFYKIWTGNKIRAALEFEGRFIFRNYSKHYSNNNEFTYTKNGFKLEVYNPLVFYPFILAVHNVSQRAAKNSSFAVKAFRPAGKNYFSVRVSPAVFDNLDISGEAALLVRTPGGFFTALQASKNKSDYIFDNSRLLDLNSAAREIQNRLGFSSSLAYMMYGAINEYKEKNDDGSKTVIFILSNNEFKIKENPARKNSMKPAGFNKYKKLNITAFPLDFIDEKKTVIPDFSFNRENNNINGTLYTRFSFNSAYYKKLLLDSGAGDKTDLCAYIEVKIPAGTGRREIEKFADFFIKSFSDNFKINDLRPNSSYMKFGADEIYRGNIFLNIIHDNKKNFSYNIAGDILTFKIINLKHYLNYNLYDAGGGINFHINEAALTWNKKPAEFNVSVKYE